MEQAWAPRPTNLAVVNIRPAARADTIMLHSCSRTILSFIGSFGQGTPRRKARRSTSIDILDDDSLLNIFHLYRLARSDEADAVSVSETWDHERSWYKLAHVCRRWRRLVLESASHLGLSLLCKNGTPTAQMLAHSPPLPLVINYAGRRQSGIAAEDEEAIMLALGHRDRVRRIRLWMPARTLQKFVTAIDNEFPILEHLDLQHPEGPTPGLTPPATLQAPHLRILLIDFAPPLLRSPLLITSAGGIATLCLFNIPSLALPPNDLIQQLSLMPHLKTLMITFRSPVPNRDAVRRLLQTQITAHATLPNLHLFIFNGVSAYLEALLPRVTAPLLDNLHIGFFNQLTFSVPYLLQFVGTTEVVGFNRATFSFCDAFVGVKVHHHGASRNPVFEVVVPCSHLDWQVSSIAQVVSSLSPVFSAVEHLNVVYKEHNQSSEVHNAVDHTQWRELLRSLNNVKNLFVENGLIGELARFLRISDGESPLELLPELDMIACVTNDDGVSDAFAPFIDARRNAGRRVTLFPRAIYHR